MSRQFDPIELLDTVEREKVNGLIIVGDAFAKPILAALDAEPGRWDLTSLVGIISSGVMWSEETKQGLLRHHPGMLLVDAFSSSEAIGMGSSVSSAGIGRPHRPVQPRARGAGHRRRRPRRGARLGPERACWPSGADPPRLLQGRSEDGGHLPHHRRNRVLGARRLCRDRRGRLHPSVGPGSVCINTGGEKVYPEEVEEVVKTIDGVADAVVVGIPNERFGEEIVAVVRAGPDPGGRDRRRDHRPREGQAGRLQGPARVRFVATIGRSPSGKVDYAAPPGRSGGVGRVPRDARADGRPRLAVSPLAPWVRTKSLTE